MAERPSRIVPQTFFLNERHELQSVPKDSGGGFPKLGAIDWAAKGTQISDSLKSVDIKIRESRDPLRGKRYFVVAVPVPTVPKISAAGGQITEKHEVADFRSKGYAKVFGRLGLDLLDVTKDGRAVVHATPATFAQLTATTALLAQTGRREQVRWAAIKEFDVIPASDRLDFAWARGLDTARRADVIIELQPLLTGTEVDDVLRAIGAIVRHRNERLSNTGVDLSGRQWARAMLSPASLFALAEQLVSIQSIHPPIFLRAATSGAPMPSPFPTASPPTGTSGSRPAVAIFDEGIPAGHLRLAPYLRSGQVIAPGADGGSRSGHAAKVASRVVFGEIEDPSAPLPTAGCDVLDVQISDAEGKILDKVIYDGLRTVVAAFPDVRVFNLSIGVETPFDVDEQSTREWSRILRQIDVFAFANDIAVIVAAGNSSSGLLPVTPYPNHVLDDRWRLGFWACGFNTFVVGAYVGRLSQGGLAGQFWPSPFTKRGPGVCKCPVPMFSAPGGNMDRQHRMQPGMGEWECDEYGNWVEDIGTSLAAPLVSREVALTLEMLRGRCPSGTRPFVGTAKAFLALVARRALDEDQLAPRSVRDLADLTLGRGRAMSDRLIRPLDTSAVFVWQGELADSDEELRVLVPLPRNWLRDAQQPHLRLVIGWETPVNEANANVWACRKVEAKLFPGVGDDVEQFKTPRADHGTYPLVIRDYDLEDAKEHGLLSDDHCLLVLSYTEQGLAEYPPGPPPTPRQRVGICAELYDATNGPVSPQQHVQLLPNASTFNVLSAARRPIGVGARIPAR